MSQWARTIDQFEALRKTNLAQIGVEATTMEVKHDRVIPVCKTLFGELPVNDIDIQEVPIEEVIRQIFAR